MLRTAQPFNSIFLPLDGDGVGHLTLAGPESLVRIVSEKAYRPSKGYVDVHGAVSDGRKASLINCVQRGLHHHYLDNGTVRNESEFIPNYVVIGDEFVSDADPVVRSVMYHFDNADLLADAHRTFRSIHPSADEARQILESEHRRQNAIAQKNGWGEVVFEPEIGDRPELLYFSGRWEVASCDILLGKVKLTNRVSGGFGGATGIGWKNQVTAAIEFSEPKTIHASVQALRALHLLFELTLGARQQYHWIDIELDVLEKDHRRGYKRAELFWSLCNQGVTPQRDRSLNDTLLVADRRPEEFVRVVGGWMNSADEMSDPRERLSTALFSAYGINRIVGGANMFDLLPPDRAPKKLKVDEKTAEVVKEARKAFKALPQTFATQSVLSALGRVGSASLREKIAHRAKIVESAFVGRCTEIDLPCGEAVLCRNHYVHGSPASFAYQDNFTEFAFLTDTLEFVFAMSDFIDLGWDYGSWLSEGSTLSHPFSRYLMSYPDNLRRLKSTLAKV